MQTILVANPKGGSGKTTLATNLAGWLAGKRQRVLLRDLDPQQSSAGWLARRPELFPPIEAAGLGAGERAAVARPQWQVIDSPAGLHGDHLRAMLRTADVLLVPLTPSAFDMDATAHFLAAISRLKGIREGAPAVGLVGVRVDARTRVAGELDAFLAECAFPQVTQLRDTQLYVHCARDGASVFDLPRSRAEQDWEQWRPLTRWIARHAAPAEGR